MRVTLLAALAAVTAAQLNDGACSTTNVPSLALTTYLDCTSTTSITADSSSDASTLDCLGQTPGELEVIYLFEAPSTGLYRFSTCDSGVQSTTAHVWSLVE
eukprot:scaffold844_cov254-Pinguiococcus_pyrenoidosus.AAC.13